jgi:NIMA (never in mitosis gene a)-related kinase
MDDFIFGELLGKGSFGSVNIVTRKQDNKQYAMKSVNINNLKEKEKLCSLNEIRILSSLNHPNIIGYHEAFFDTKTRTLNIVMEYAEGGDLHQKIKNNIKAHLHFTEKTIWDWIIQILEGLKYLHDNKIMHRDLKCANIFISKDKILKLGDLNLSIIAKREWPKQKQVHHIIVLPKYGKTYLTITKAIYGLWAVFYMNYACLNHHLEELVLKI